MQHFRLVDTGKYVRGAVTVLDTDVLWKRLKWIGGDWLIYQEEDVKRGRPTHWRLRLGRMRTATPDEDPERLPSMGMEAIPTLVAEHTAIGNLLFPKIIARLYIGGNTVASQWHHIAEQLGWAPSTYPYLQVAFDKAQELLKQWEVKREV